MLAAGLLLGASLLLAAGLVGCRSNRVKPSLWPPRDFELRVAGTRLDEATGRPVMQRFLVQRDGFAVYRESTKSLPTEALALPIFDTVAVYRIRPESIRTLGRLLESTRLFDQDVGQEVNRGVGDPDVAVSWRAFDEQGHLSSFVDSGGVLDRVVRVLNAFTPEGHEFEFPELSGEREARRTTRVPPPMTWPRGSLLCHKQFVELLPDEVDLWIDLFSLAYVERDVDAATEAFEAIAEAGSEAWPDADYVVVDWDQECLAPLRGLLDEVTESGDGDGEGDGP